jgi:hypothetical protein
LIFIHFFNNEIFKESSMPNIHNQPSFVCYVPLDAESGVGEANAKINQGSYKERALVANASKKTASFFSKVKQWVKENIQSKRSSDTELVQEELPGMVYLGKKFALKPNTYARFESANTKPVHEPKAGLKTEEEPIYAVIDRTRPGEVVHVTVPAVEPLTEAVTQLPIDPLARYKLKSAVISSFVNAKKSENKAVRKSVEMVEKVGIKEEKASRKAEVKATLQTEKDQKKFKKMASRAILMSSNSVEAHRALEILKARFADGIDKNLSTRL